MKLQVTFWGLQGTNMHGGLHFGMLLKNTRNMKSDAFKVQFGTKDAKQLISEEWMKFLHI